MIVKYFIALWLLAASVSNDWCKADTFAIYSSTIDGADVKLVVANATMNFGSVDVSPLRSLDCI